MKRFSILLLFPLALMASCSSEDDKPAAPPTLDELLTGKSWELDSTRYQYEGYDELTVGEGEQIIFVSDSSVVTSNPDHWLYYGPGYWYWTREQTGIIIEHPGDEGPPYDLDVLVLTEDKLALQWVRHSPDITYTYYFVLTD